MNTNNEINTYIKYIKRNSKIVYATQERLSLETSTLKQTAYVSTTSNIINIIESNTS